MDWLSDVYLVCAVVGGTLLVLQTILLAIGGHHDGDVGADTVDVHHGDVGQGHDASGFIKWLSLKTVVACLTFFGLAGLASEKAGLSPWIGLSVSVAAGMGAIVVVGFLMASMSRLQSTGTLDLKNAVGLAGKVYLRVPGGRAGSGKVTLEVQGRYVEAEAVTTGPEIPTGTPVRVLAVTAPNLLEVAVLER